TDPANPVVIGTGQTDANGKFSIQVVAGHFKADGSTDGPKVIGVQAADINGIRGNIALLRFTLDTRAPVAPPAPDLEAGSDSGQSNTDDLTNFNDATPAKAPVFDVGTAASPIEARATVQLFRAPVVGGVVGAAVLVATLADTAGGVVPIADTGG